MLGIEKNVLTLKKNVLWSNPCLHSWLKRCTAGFHMLQIPHTVKTHCSSYTITAWTLDKYSRIYRFNKCQSMVLHRVYQKDLYCLSVVKWTFHIYIETFKALTYSPHLLLQINCLPRVRFWGELIFLQFKLGIEGVFKTSIRPSVVRMLLTNNFSCAVWLG